MSTTDSKNTSERYTKIVNLFHATSPRAADSLSLRTSKDEQRRVAWYAYACELQQGLHLLTRPSWPLRPDTLPSDDMELRRALMLSRNKPSLLRQDFMAWRRRLQQAEHRAAGNIACVFYALDAIRNVGDVLALPQAAHFVQWLAHEYQVDALPLPAACRFDGLAMRAARQSALMPDWLMDGTPPPCFDPAVST